VRVCLFSAAKFPVLCKTVRLLIWPDFCAGHNLRFRTLPGSWNSALPMTSYEDFASRRMHSLSVLHILQCGKVARRRLLLASNRYASWNRFLWLVCLISGTYYTGLHRFQNYTISDSTSQSTPPWHPCLLLCVHSTWIYAFASEREPSLTDANSCGKSTWQYWWLRPKADPLSLVITTRSCVNTKGAGDAPWAATAGRHWCGCW
jgi:hypothetical protein